MLEYNKGHVLIIPKKHYLDDDEIPTEILLAMMELSKKIVRVIKEIYFPDGYSIMENGGEFNDIGHYHMHIFPRYREDGFLIKEIKVIIALYCNINIVRSICYDYFMCSRKHLF